MSPLGGEAAVWLRRLSVMTRKELLQLVRDPILVGFILYAFTVNLWLAGRAVSFQLREAVLLVHDADRSPASRELVARFRAPEFRVAGEVARAEGGLRRLDGGSAMLLLDIPPRFEAALLRGGPATVQLQVDATNSGLAFLATSYGARIVGGYGLEEASRLGAPGAGEPLPVVDGEQRLWFNQNATDAWGTVIIELLVMVTVLAILLPASAMVREKERGTVEQLLVSPLSPSQIMMPKVLAMTLVVLACTAVSLFGLLRLSFHVPVRGSLALFFLVTALYVFTTTGLGLLIATVTRNLAQVGMLLSAALPPLVFLSGAWSPPEAMPAWLRAGTLVLSLRHYLDCGFGILLKGAGVAVLWPRIAAIAGLGGALFALGAWRFRRQFG